MIHTYSGYENKVKDTLEKSVENNGMQDLIFEVRVPMEEVVEIRNGKRVKSTRKVYPGYVLVHMIGMEPSSRTILWKLPLTLSSAVSPSASGIGS